METRDQIRAKVEQQFDLELAAIRRLDGTSDGLLDLLPQQGLQTEGDRILAMAVARGMTAFKAVLSLIEEGFGREALMLNRSMFEGAAVAYWVFSNQEKAAEHFALANEHEIHLMGEKLDAVGIEDPVPSGLGRLSGAKLEKAQKLLGKDNQRLWLFKRRARSSRLRLDSALVERRPACCIKSTELTSFLRGARTGLKPARCQAPDRRSGT